MGKYSDMFRRVEDGSPEQCGANDKRGRCMNAKMPGSDYCPAHGGNRGFTKFVKERKRLYDVQQYRAKLNDLQDHEEANSFREEIAVLRMALETRLRHCKEDYDLMLHSGILCQLVQAIEKALIQANKLEIALGKHLSEEQALGWVTEVIEIVSKYVTDPDVLDNMGGEILESMDRAWEAK